MHAFKILNRCWHKSQNHSTEELYCAYWIHSLLVLYSATDDYSVGGINLKERINQPGLLHVCNHNNVVSEVELTPKWKPYFKELKATRGRFMSASDTALGMTVLGGLSNSPDWNISATIHVHLRITKVMTFPQLYCAVISADHHANMLN